MLNHDEAGQQIQQEAQVARWRGGEVARWRGGEVARWRGWRFQELSLRSSRADENRTYDPSTVRFKQNQLS